MQEAIPYRNRIPTTLNHQQNDVGEIRFVASDGWRDDVRKMVKENAVMVISRRGCCMGHVVKRLLQSLGVNPAVYEVEEGWEDDVVTDLRAAVGETDGVAQFPAVFIGGRWFGGLDRVMATHITGELTPLLKQAGALWL